MEFKSLNSEVKNSIVQEIVSWNFDVQSEDEIEKGYLLVDLLDNVGDCLFKIVKDEVRENIIEDFDYEECKTYEAKERYIAENLFERFFDITLDIRRELCDMVISEFDKLGYTCRDDGFISVDGYLQSLNCDEVAFIKREI